MAATPLALGAPWGDGHRWRRVVPGHDDRAAGNTHLVTHGGRPFRAISAVAGTLGVLGASFLPWARSGSASRTSYEVVEAARRLELVDGVWASLALSWFFVPLLVVCAGLSATLGRPVATATLSAVVGSTAVGLAAAVEASPLDAEVGTSVALAAGAMALVGAGRLAWERRSRP